MKYAKFVWFVVSAFLSFFYVGCGTRIYMDDASAMGDRSVQEVAVRDVVLDVSRATEVGGADVVMDVSTRTSDILTVSVDVPSQGQDVSVDSSRMTTVVDVGAVRLMGMALSPTTCHGRTLHLPDAMTEPGWQAFHLCYVTLDSRDRLDGGVGNPRPASLDFGVAAVFPTQLVPVVTALAPTTADPWTASVAVAMPIEIAAPGFNIRHQLPSPREMERIWGLNSTGGNGIVVRGTLRLWRVDSNGVQTEVPVQMLFSICGGGIPAGGMPGALYAPEGVCPAGLQSCSPAPYHCRR